MQENHNKCFVSLKFVHMIFLYQILLKQDLQEVNKNYSKLVQVAEEAMKRRKMTQKQNTQLIREREKI